MMHLNKCHSLWCTQPIYKSFLAHLSQSEFMIIEAKLGKISLSYPHYTSFSGAIIWISFKFLIIVKQEAECEKLRMDAKYAADTKVADSKRQFEMQKAAFDMEVNARVGITWHFITVFPDDCCLYVSTTGLQGTYLGCLALCTCLTYVCLSVYPYIILLVAGENCYKW